MTRVRLVFCMFLFLPFWGYAQQDGKYLERPLPDGWQEKDTLFQQVLPVDDQWWKVFEDATLDSLINLAMEQNPSGRYLRNKKNLLLNANTYLVIYAKLR